MSSSENNEREIEKLKQSYTELLTMVNVESNKRKQEVTNLYEAINMTANADARISRKMVSNLYKTVKELAVRQGIDMDYDFRASTLLGSLKKKKRSKKKKTRKRRKTKRRN
jgi:hypothetical protein